MWEFYLHNRIRVEKGVWAAALMEVEEEEENEDEEEEEETWETSKVLVDEVCGW